MSSRQWPHRGIRWPSRANPASPHARLWWILNPDDPYPCPDCQEYARRGPYGRPGSRQNELDAMPGDGHTRCGAACTCALSYDPPAMPWTPHGVQRRAGRLPFTRMELYFVEGEEPDTDDEWLELLVSGLQWARPNGAELGNVLTEMGVVPGSAQWQLAMTRLLAREGKHP